MKSVDTQKNYQITYTILRILACVSVIAHHFINALYGSSGPIEQKVFLILDNFLMCNNGLFFMLSGKFALEGYKEGAGENIAQYYKNKLIRIVLPLFIVSLIFYVKDNVITFRFFEIWKFFKAFMNNQVVSYFWFVYALIGFYLVVPFFAPMFKKMNAVEKNVLFIILIGMMFWKNLSELFKFRFDIGGYPFLSYITFCFLGYLVDHMDILRKKEWLIYLGTGFCALLSTCEVVFKSGWNPSIYGFSLTRIIMCIGVFIFVTRHTGWLADKMKNGILAIGRYTYYIYLFHGLSQQIVMKAFNRIPLNHFAYFLMGTGFTFLGALVFAVLFQKILSLADRFLSHISNKN